MSVCPLWLNGVPSYIIEANQLKSLWRKRLRRSFVDIAHNVRFAFTPGAWAIPPQLLQRNITFAAILPFDGQFSPNLLNVRGLHVQSRIMCCRTERFQRGLQLAQDVEKENQDAYRLLPARRTRSASTARRAPTVKASG